ncbi:MAG TPA: phosphoglycolate phosphatase [Burkholderiaceae bacterium]
MTDTALPTLRAVLIDLDGTLMDTAPDLAEAVNRMRADFGLHPLPVPRIAQFVGKGADVLVHRAMADDLAGRIDAAEFERSRAAFTRHYRDVNGELAVVFDGVPQALGLLRERGLRVACVTNKPREFTLPLLERAGLSGWFHTVVAGDEVAHRKPHPEIVLTACARLQATPSESILIGDSANDAEAAHAAGCRAVLVDTGYNEGESVRLLAGRYSVGAILPTLFDAVRWVLASSSAPAPQAV